MNKQFVSWIVVVFLLSLFVRVVGLGSINQVVFDEVHFGKFISSYCCTHQRFFDIHPPIGKLLIAGGAYLAGYNGQFSFDHIGQSYRNVPISAIRMIPALFGAMLPVIIMILLWQAGVSASVSIIGGIAVALENSLIVESRYILTDSILLTAIFGCIAATIAAVQTTSKQYSWFLAMFAGVLAGVAVGTKFTGAIGGLLAVLILCAHGIRATTWKQVHATFGKIVVLGIAASAVYLLGWVLHFSLLTVSGLGDVWGMPSGMFWKDLLHIHQQMLSANYNLTAGHPYGSAWWTWPFMVRSVFYWQGGGSAFVYFLGNPVVWWGSTLLLCCGLLYSFTLIAKGIFTKINTIAWVFLLGYGISFVPLMRIPRVLFLYHYLTPFLFSLLFGLWWLDYVLRHKGKTKIAYPFICIIVGFLFISPLTYGIGISQQWQHVLFFISTWR